MCRLVTDKHVLETRVMGSPTQPPGPWRPTHDFPKSFSRSQAMANLWDLQTQWRGGQWEAEKSEMEWQSRRGGEEEGSEKWGSEEVKQRIGNGGAKETEKSEIDRKEHRWDQMNWRDERRWDETRRGKKMRQREEINIKWKKEEKIYIMLSQIKMKR